MRRFTPLLIATSLIAGGARADEAVATAARTEVPPAVLSDTATQIEDFLRTAPAPSLKDDTPDGIVPPERKVHGQVGVTVGSGGYRSAYVTSVMPVGQTGTLALAVSETRFGKMGGPGWGGGFGGYGEGTRRTVGVSLALGDAAQPDCRPRVRGYEPYGFGRGPEHATCRAPTDVEP